MFSWGELHWSWVHLAEALPSKVFLAQFYFQYYSISYIIQKIHSKVGSKIKAKHQTWKKFSSGHKKLWCLNHWSLLTPKVCRCDGRQRKHVSREQWGHSKVFQIPMKSTTRGLFNWNPRPETKTWWRQWSAGSATRLGMEAALALLFLGAGQSIWSY